MHHKIRRFTKGQSASSLEKIILNCVEGIEEIRNRNEIISKHTLELGNRVSNSLRNAQTIRYKAFEAHGSNQSFSIALLNEKGNGVVISSLHSHERVSTFAKPVIDYESTHDLTDEEKSVINDAKKEHKLYVV